MIKQYDIWLANLNPLRGSEPGKTRPVAIVQTDLLNEQLHPSTVICPITTNVLPEYELLRVHLSQAQLPKTSDILIDQVRAIDNARLIKKIGELSAAQRQRLKRNLRILLDL